MNENTQSNHEQIQEHYPKALLSECLNVMNQLIELSDENDVVIDSTIVVIAQYITEIKTVLRKLSETQPHITHEQLLDSQIEALRACICHLHEGKKIYETGVSQ